MSIKEQLVRKSQSIILTGIEVILSNPIAIHDHTDIMTAIELELAHIAEYEDKLEALRKYFPVGE